MRSISPVVQLARNIPSKVPSWEYPVPYRPRESDLRLMMPEFEPALRMTLEMLVFRTEPSFSRTAIP